MVETTERVIAFATDAMRRTIEGLLDDPSWMVDDPDVDPIIHIAEIRRTAEDLGMDFDLILAEIGSEYEIERLNRLEHGSAAHGRRTP